MHPKIAPTALGYCPTEQAFGVVITWLTFRDWVQRSSKVTTTREPKPQRICAESVARHGLSLPRMLVLGLGLALRTINAGLGLRTYMALVLALLLRPWH